MKGLPAWLEALIIRAIENYLPESVIVEAVQAWKDQLVAWAKAEVANTANKIDDMVVDHLAQALTVCDVDKQFLCDLVNRGEDFVIEKLKDLAQRSDTKLDDAAVDILAVALKA